MEIAWRTIQQEQDKQEAAEVTDSRDCTGPQCCFHTKAIGLFLNEVQGYKNNKVWPLFSITHTYTLTPALSTAGCTDKQNNSISGMPDGLQKHGLVLYGKLFRGGLLDKWRRAEVERWRTPYTARKENASISERKADPSRGVPLDRARCNPHSPCLSTPRVNTKSTSSQRKHPCSTDPASGICDADPTASWRLAHEWLNLMITPGW